MSLVEVREIEGADGKGIIRLLALSMGDKSEKNVRAKAEMFAGGKGFRMIGYLEDDRYLGVVVYRESLFRIEIVNIGVMETMRRRGIGRELIMEIRRRKPGKTIFLETDEDGEKFYGRVGFVVRNLGERYPGVIRFQCVMK
jgi:ribosomal protein S18 acetylase RimI-like enzyme